MKLFTIMNQSADPRIRFETKEESNERRTKEALARTPEERLRFFLELCQEFSQFYPIRDKENTDNFILTNENI